jgi:hypothetical protein
MARPDLTYEQAAHAVQTGVAHMLHHNPRSADPKHLRTGLDLRAADAAGLARLLIAKGVFTEAEYLEAVRVAAVEEVARYEAAVADALEAKTGNRPDITLH